MGLMILYYIINKKMVIRQLDVESDFLEGTLKEDIYISGNQKDLVKLMNVTGCMGDLISHYMV